MHTDIRAGARTTLTTLVLAILLTACTAADGDECPATGFPQGSCSTPHQRCGELDECGNGTAAVCENGAWVITDFDSMCGCGLPCPATCPGSLPADLSPCEGDGAWCAYDDPTCAGAEYTATCGAGAWHITHTGPVCPGDCPTTAPEQGDTCEEPGIDCGYPDAACASTGLVAYCSGGAWSVSAFDSCTIVCPASLPAEGAVCGGCCQPTACAYLDAGGCPVHATCNNGSWQHTADTCEDPISACATLDADACNQSASCRWLGYPTCATSLQTFPQGCYPAKDCTSDASCGAGSTCQVVEANPCPSVNCDSCVFQTMICAP